jgi:hypothetical protein
MTGYTCNTRIYLGKDRQNSTQMMTAAHAIVRIMIGIVESIGHKLYMGNFFSSPDLMTCAQEVSTVVDVFDKEC